VAVHNLLNDLDEGKHLASLPTHLYGGSTLAAVIARQSTSDFKKQQKSTKSSTGRSVDVRQRGSVGEFAKYYRWYTTDLISWAEFESNIKRVLEDLYTEMYFLGLKSSGNLVGYQGKRVILTTDEKKMIDSMVAHEKIYLYSFLQDIKSGKEKNPVGRFERFAQSAEAAYNNAATVNLHPYTVVHWVRHFSESCAECLLMEKWSPFCKWTIPALPKSGFSRCLQNCLCTTIEREGTPNQIKKILQTSYSRKYMLELLRKSKSKR